MAAPFTENVVYIYLLVKMLPEEFHCPQHGLVEVRRDQVVPAARVSIKFVVFPVFQQNSSQVGGIADIHDRVILGVVDLQRTVEVGDVLSQRDRQ